MEVIVCAEELKEMPIGTKFFCRLRGTMVRGDVWKTIRRSGAVVMESTETRKMRTIRDKANYEYILC